MTGPSARRCLFTIGLTLTACVHPPAVTVQQLDAGRLGTVRVFSPAGTPDACVFIFSDADGWTPALEGAATTIAASSAVVVGVDLRAYQRGLAASDDGCHYLISEIEALSQQLQRRYGFAGYRSPILAGIGAGGTLAYAALAQSPAATIAGALSVDPAPSVKTKVPLCPGAVSQPADGGFAYGARADLPGWWKVVGHAALDPRAASLAAAAHATVTSRATESAADALTTALQTTLGKSRDAPDARASLDLPLVEYPVPAHGSVMTIIYSGDGGWRDLDKQIAGVLATRNVPVVGVDSLRYFWHEKSPEQVALDLRTIIRFYTARWGTPKVALIGYSFGADVVPFAVNRLPEEDRAKIIQISLLGLEPTALFEISVAGWILNVTGDREVLPELLRLDLERVQCFYGEEEEDTLCRSPKLAGAEIIRTGGGHHFGGDYADLAATIIEGFQGRLPPAT